MTLITLKVGEIIPTIQSKIKKLREDWDDLVWKASDENREMVKARLDQHARSIEDSSLKSPYFDFEE